MAALPLSLIMSNARVSVRIEEAGEPVRGV